MFPLEVRLPMRNRKAHYREAFRTAAIAPDTRMLIVDPDRKIGVALSSMLSARGYDDVRAVRSAARAIAVAEQFLPGMIFLDMEMPDMGSLALAQQLRRDARQRVLRLIALTRDAEHGMRDEARVAGFERYLTKPVAHEELDKILGKPVTTSP
jgi:CheY-like chemotaxis protein